MADELSVPNSNETLAMQSQQVADDMVATNDVDKVKDLTHLFNLLQAKKKSPNKVKLIFSSLDTHLNLSYLSA